MVMLIEELHSIKEYKIETLFQAVSLADRYLVYISVCSNETPCLATLAVTSLLMAAKLEQPISPSFTRMINLLKEKH